MAQVRHAPHPTAGLHVNCPSKPYEQHTDYCHRQIAAMVRHKQSAPRGQLGPVERRQADALHLLSAEGTDAEDLQPAKRVQKKR